MKSIAAALSLLLAAGIARAQERRLVQSRDFVLTIHTSERVSFKALWVSTDGGRTWKTSREAGVREGWGEWSGGAIRCSVVVPRDGAYDFYAQFGDSYTNRKPDPQPGQAPDPRLRFEARERQGGLDWEEPKTPAEWPSGSQVTLRWAARGGEMREHSAELQYSADSEPWITITKGLEGTGQFTWVVPNRETANLRLRVRALTRTGHEASAVSEPVTVHLTSRPNVTQARALYDRARILSAQQRHAEAMLKYQEALAAWNDFAEVHNDLGKAYADQNEPAKALEYFLRARRLAPSDPTSYVNAAMMEVRLGLFGDALADLRDAIAFGMEREERTSVLAGEMLWKIAYSYAQAGDRKTALEASELLLTLRQASRPTRGKAQQMVAWIKAQ